MRRFLLVLSLATALSTGTAQANPYPVTNTGDVGAGSLRAAIEAANTNAGADTIPIRATGTIELATALPTITGEVAISGPGPQALTIARAASAPSFRILDIGPSIAASVEGFAIRGGLARVGGGISSSSPLELTNVVVTDNEAEDSGGVKAIARGGGIFCSKNLIVSESVIRGNRVTATGGSEESFATGGGIYATEAQFIEGSTIAENLVQASAEGGTFAQAYGGGIRAFGSAVEIESSTISGNSVTATGASNLNLPAGGGIQGRVELTGSTVTRNSAAGGENESGANLDLTLSIVRDTIVGEPVGDRDSCAGDFVSDGFNLDEDGSCGFGKSTDLVNEIADLEPLASNGGPTPTQALGADSAAIDRGNAFGSSFDQRGLPRPSDFPAISNTEDGDGSDIGAFELQVPPPVVNGGPVLVSQQPADRQPPNTRIVKGPARSSYETKAKFRFASSEAQSSFQCKLDEKKWTGCRNPVKRTVKPGKHVFKVRAIDRFGNVDPTPARFGWRVKPLS
jgi:hypothetical protein